MKQRTVERIIDSGTDERNLAIVAELEYHLNHCGEEMLVGERSLREALKWLAQETYWDQ